MGLETTGKLSILIRLIWGSNKMFNIFETAIPNANHPTRIKIDDDPDDPSDDDSTEEETSFISPTHLPTSIISNNLNICLLVIPLEEQVFMCQICLLMKQPSPII